MAQTKRRSTSRKTSTRKTSTKKRKPTSRTREVAPEHEVPGGFWRQASAILLLAAAVLIIFTWFGDGGEVMNQANAGLLYVIGYATYILPVILVWLAVQIFRAEGNRIPRIIIVSSIFLLCLSSGLLGLFATNEDGQNGGVVGNFLNQNIFLQIGNVGLAAFLYIVLILITLLFVLSINPATFFQAMTKGLRTTEKEDKKNAHVARAAEAEDKPKKRGDIDIRVNGIEEDKADAKPAKRGLFASKAPSAPTPIATAKIPESDPDKALTLTSDPEWENPPIEILEKKNVQPNGGDTRNNAEIIRSTLADFGIEVEMREANVGPSITQYTLRPPAGIKLNRIENRDKELALNLATEKIRIEAPIPGTSLVGVEVQNKKSASVNLRGIIESNEWKRRASDPLTFAVGKDISGNAVVANLGDMRHLLIAGTTGSGKSVMTNTLLTSMLYHNSPSDLKLIIVDPKQVEMAQYDAIPHLLAPIITQPDKAVSAVKWAVDEMERRYTVMAEERVKTISDYNIKMAKKSSEQAATRKTGDTDNAEDAPKESFEKMPYIVVLVDEMADIMMMAGKDLELPLVRIAQKGRAAGVHLVLATQRPEVKVITGLLKANIPSRIAFAVGSQVDSRVMIDKPGAEKLVGRGDMLMLTSEMMGRPRRIQGAWVSDQEIEQVTEFLRKQRLPEYNKEVTSQTVQIKGMETSSSDSGMGGLAGGLGRKFDPNDPLVRKAVEISLSKGKFATSMLQTYLGKGHGFVSGLGIWFEEIGVIGPENGRKPRELLISSMEEFDQLANLGGDETTE